MLNKTKSNYLLFLFITLAFHFFCCSREFLTSMITTFSTLVSALFNFFLALVFSLIL